MALMWRICSTYPFPEYSKGATYHFQWNRMLSLPQCSLQWRIFDRNRSHSRRGWIWAIRRDAERLNRFVAIIVLEKWVVRFAAHQRWPLQSGMNRCAATYSRHWSDLRPRFFRIFPVGIQLDSSWWLLFDKRNNVVMQPKIEKKTSYMFLQWFWIARWKLAVPSNRSTILNK